LIDTTQGVKDNTVLTATTVPYSILIIFEEQQKLYSSMCDFFIFIARPVYLLILFITYVIYV